MRDLITKVIGWAEERNILLGSTPVKQLDKTSEEFNELQRAVAAYTIFNSLNVEIDNWRVDFCKDKYLAATEVKDAFGDILVTLIIAAKQLNLDLEDCLGSAWEEIKDRRGKMINGKFVKEADL